MTQYPNYYYPTPAINPRPTSVTVLAIIGIILAALALVCNGLSLAAVFVPFGPPNPVMEQLRQDAVLFGWSVFSGIGRLVLAIVLLGGSIAALMLKPAGRLALIAYSWAMIALSLVDTVITFALINPIIEKQLGNVPNAAAFRVGQQVGYVFGILFALTYPILVLVFMNKARVKAAFAGAGGYPQAGSPGYYAPVPPGQYAPPGNDPFASHGPYGQQ